MERSHLRGLLQDLNRKATPKITSRFFKHMLIWLACVAVVAVPLILIDFWFDEYQLFKLLGYSLLSTPLICFGLASGFDSGEYVIPCYQNRFQAFGLVLLCLAIAIFFRIFFCFGVLGIAGALVWNMLVISTFLRIFITIVEWD